MTMKLERYLLSALLVTGLVGGREACAQAKPDDYPVRSVRLIVPFSPGGLNDIVARLVGQRLNERWGQPMVIDNRAGAGGNIAVEIGARAAPDGYTLTLGSIGPFATNVSLSPKLPYDPRRDFAPITLIATAPQVLVVNATVAAKSVQEFIQLARANPKKLNYSSVGEGTFSHLVGEMFKSMAGVDIVHVPYKGGGPALVAAIAGEVQMTSSNIAVALPQMKAGKVRAIAVTSAKRASALPEVPTITESGLAGFEATAWVGIAAPAGTPRALIRRLNHDIHAVIGETEMKNQFVMRGLEPAPTAPEEFARYIRDEIERWSKVVREAGLRVE